MPFMYSFPSSTSQKDSNGTSPVPEAPIRGQPGPFWAPPATVLGGLFHPNYLHFCPVTSPTLCKRNQNARFCLFSQSRAMIAHRVPVAFSSQCLSSINFHNIPHFTTLIHFFVYLLCSNKLFVKRAPVKSFPNEKVRDHLKRNAVYRHSLCMDTVPESLLKLRGEITTGWGQWIQAVFSWTWLLLRMMMLCSDAIGEQSKKSKKK